jgi:hypothetical protein
MKKIFILFSLFFFLFSGIVSAQEYELIPSDYTNVKIVIQPSTSEGVELMVLFLTDVTENISYVYHLDKDTTEHIFESGELYPGHKYQMSALVYNLNNEASDFSNILYAEVEKGIIPNENKPVKKDKPIPPGLQKKQ